MNGIGESIREVVDQSSLRLNLTRPNDEKNLSLHSDFDPWDLITDMARLLLPSMKQTRHANLLSEGHIKNNLLKKKSLW